MKAGWVIAGISGAGLVFMLATPGCLTDERYSVKTHCLAKVKQLSTSLLLYAAANDDRAPNQDWLDHLLPLTKGKEVESCPLIIKQGKKFGYAMNEAILGRPIGVLDPTTIAFFDTGALGPSVVANLAAISYRHGRGVMTGRLDGGAKFMLNPKYQSAADESRKAP